MGIFGIFGTIIAVFAVFMAVNPSSVDEAIDKTGKEEF